MATLSSILAWRIPWTEEPGRLFPWGHKELATMEHAHMFDSLPAQRTLWTNRLSCQILQIKIQDIQI